MRERGPRAWDKSLKKKCLAKFLFPVYNYYVYDMEQAVILKKEIRCLIGGVTVPKGTTVIYSSSMKAVNINTKSNMSNLWIAVREKDIKIIGWKTIK